MSNMVFKRKKDKLVFLFDIGSGSVGVAAVVLPKDTKLNKFNPYSLNFEKISAKKPEMIFTARIPIILAENIDSESFLKSMLIALRETAEKLEKMRLGLPDEVFCFLAAPWYLSQTRIIKYRKNNFLFDKKFARDIMQKEVKNFKKDLEEKYTIGVSMRLVEQNIIDIKLNGYKCNQPFNRRVKEAEIAFFLSFAPEKTIVQIEETVEQFFNQRISFKTYLFTKYIALNDLGYVKNENTLLIDVGGEVTDLAVIRGGVLEETVTFPLGRNYLFRLIARELNLDSFEASSALKLYLTGCLEKNICRKLDKIMQMAEEGWAAYFRATWQSVSQNNHVPSIAHLSVDDDVAPWFKKVIEREFGIQMFSGQKNNVILYPSSVLSRFCRLGKDVRPDIFLIFETLFINRIM